MGSMIVNELKRGSARRLFKAYLIGIVLLCVTANIAVLAFRLVYGSHEGTFAYNIMTYATWCFFVPYYSCIIIADIIFGRVHPALKKGDKPSGDMPPAKLYLVKLSASVILAFFFMAVALVCFLSVTLLFHISEKSISFYDIRDFIEKMVYAIPLWLSGIGIGNMFLFVFPNKKEAYLSYFLLTVVFERGIMFLAAEPLKIEVCRKIRTILITQLLSLIPYPADPARNITLTVFLGFLYLLLSTVMGMMIFSGRSRAVSG